MVGLAGTTTLDDVDGQRLHIESVTIHPSFNPNNVRFRPADVVDLAVVRVLDHIQLGIDHNAQPIVLASPRADDLTAPGTRVRLAGWGDTEGDNDYRDYSPELQEITSAIEEPDVCRGDSTYLAPGQYSDFNPMFNLCVQHRTTGGCAGDGGGPLVAELNGQDFQVGVFSSLAPNQDCASRRTEGQAATGFSAEFQYRQDNQPGRPNFEKHVDVLYWGSWIQEHTGTLLPDRYPVVRETGRPTPNPTKSTIKGDCRNRCGQESLRGDCWCDVGCSHQEDCCDDFDRTCALESRPPEGSCSDHGACGFKSGACWCDSQCLYNEDCCPDYVTYCGKLGGGQNSCVGRCGGLAGGEFGCWCDNHCALNGDCCLDVAICQATTDGSGSCAGHCGVRSGHCWCDPGCEESGDCCPNYYARCGAPNACEGYCGHKSGNCWCDVECERLGDCCPGFTHDCAHVYAKQLAKLDLVRHLEEEEAALRAEGAAGGQSPTRLRPTRSPTRLPTRQPTPPPTQQVFPTRFPTPVVVPTRFPTPFAPTFSRVPPSFAQLTPRPTPNTQVRPPAAPITRTPPVTRAPPTFASRTTG